MTFLHPPIHLSPRHLHTCEVIDAGSSKRAAIATFTTGGKVDSRKPTLPTLKARFSQQQYQCCTCGSGRPEVKIDIAGTHKKAINDLLYGAWTGVKGKVDFSQEPNTYLRSFYGMLGLGDGSLCSPDNYPIPKSGRMTIGIRAMDFAGNLSKPRIVNVKVRRLKKR